jgi:hypothetical protein
MERTFTPNEIVLAMLGHPSFALQTEDEAVSARPFIEAHLKGGLPANKTKREAERRKAHPTMAASERDAAAARARAARLPALRGGACRSERTLQLSPGRASRDQEDAGVTGAIDRA